MNSGGENDNYMLNRCHLGNGERGDTRLVLNHSTFPVQTSVGNGKVGGKNYVAVIKCVYVDNFLFIYNITIS